MIKRILTALVLLPLFVLLVLKAPIGIVKIVILGVTGLCIYELLDLFDMDVYLILLAEVVGVNAVYFLLNWQAYQLFVFYVIIALFFVPYLIRFDRERFFREYFFVVSGLIYVVIAMYSFWNILEISRLHLLWFFSVVFACDTGAYFSGKFLGRRPFFSEISPKKTLEGFIGGLLLGVITGLLLNYYFKLFSVNQVINLSLAVGIVESFGDLFESAIKRVAGKKDSGKIIWGHGGILDRIDGAMMAAPLFLIGIKVLGG